MLFPLPWSPHTATRFEDECLIVAGLLQAPLVVNFPADSLLLLHQFRRPVQVTAFIKDNRLISEGSLECFPVVEFSADFCLLLKQRHGPVHIASLVSSIGFVLERHLQLCVRDPALVVE
jgi:hypothetical protein